MNAANTMRCNTKKSIQQSRRHLMTQYISPIACSTVGLGGDLQQEKEEQEAIRNDRYTIRVPHHPYSSPFTPSSSSSITTMTTTTTVRRRIVDVIESDDTGWWRGNRTYTNSGRHRRRSVFGSSPQDNINWEKGKGKGKAKTKRKGRGGPRETRDMAS